MNKPLWITTILFFLLINTTYFWEGMLGGWAMIEMLGLFLSFIVLVFILFYQVNFAIKEKLQNKQRLFLIAFLTFTLLSTAAKPNGIIDYEKFEGKDLLIAGRRGVAGCHTILKLKEGSRYYIETFCFGIDKVVGSYSISNDTVKFENNKTYKFGVIKPDNYPNSKQSGHLYLHYLDGTETLGFNIVKNEIIKE